MTAKAFAILTVAVISVGCSSTKPFQKIPFDTHGNSYPFPNTAKGVQDYANKQSWGSKKKVAFTDVGDNSIYKTPCYANSYNEVVYCGGGYVKITDPLGTRICELSDSSGLKYYRHNGQMTYKTEKCSKK